MNNNRLLANNLLAFFILLFTIVIVFSTLYFNRSIYEFPHLVRVHSPFAFLLAPTLYFYIKSLQDNMFKLKLTHSIHLIPSVMIIFYFLPIYLMTFDEKIIYLNKSYLEVTTDRYVFGISLLSQCYIYLSYSLYLFVKKPKMNNLKTTWKYGWIKGVISIMIVLTIIGTVRFFIDYTYKTSHIIPIAFSILIYSLGYIGLKKTEIFIQPVMKKKYSYSSLNESNISSLFTRLIDLVNSEKLFLDQKISLKTLSVALGVSTNDLSRVINETLNKNFYDFINELRVEEVKRRLLNNDHEIQTLESIGFESGFNSKSSFYSVFKKVTGATPLQFKKSLK